MPHSHEEEPTLAEPLFAWTERSVRITIHPESIRIAAYVMFWSMVATAVTLSTALLAPGILEGSPLNLVLGYNNICVYWDFPQVEPYIAMFYPFVEIPLVTYVMVLQLRWQQVPHRSNFTRHIGAAFGFLSFLLCIWFRMIFVQKAFDHPIDEPEKWPVRLGWAAPESVFYHTLPFWGLQVALAIVGAQNFYYYIILDSRVENKDKGETGWKLDWKGVLYIVGLLGITCCKLTYGYLVYSGALAVVVPGSKPIEPTAIGHFGKVLDSGWMFFAAVTPLFLAIKRRRDDKYSKLRISFSF